MNKNTVDLGANIEAIKSVVSCDVLAARETRLRASGPNMVGLCPLHEEKTPSFYVYAGDPSGHHYDRWECFGCKRYGDVIDLYQALYGPSNNLVFAMQNMAEHFNIKLWRREDFLDEEELAQERAEREAQAMEKKVKTDLVVRRYFEQEIMPMIRAVEDPQQRARTLARCLREAGL